MGARLRRCPWSDRADQRTLRGKNRRHSAIRTSVPERFVSFAHDADELLPLLGNRAVDGLRARALPPHERYSPLRFLKNPNAYSSRRAFTGSNTANGRNSTPLVRLNMAEFTPVPNASDNTA